MTDMTDNHAHVEPMPLASSEGAGVEPGIESSLGHTVDSSVDSLIESLCRLRALTNDDRVMNSPEVGFIRSHLFLVPAVLQEWFLASRKLVRNLENWIKRYQQLDASELGICLPNQLDDLQRYYNGTSALLELSQVLLAHLIGLQRDARAVKSAAEHSAAEHEKWKRRWGAALCVAVPATFLGLGWAVMAEGGLAVAAGAGTAMAGSTASYFSNVQQAASARGQETCQGQAEVVALMLAPMQPMQRAAQWMRDLFDEVQAHLGDNLDDLRRLEFCPLGRLTPGMMRAIAEHQRNMRRVAPGVISVCQSYQEAMRQCEKIVRDINATVGPAPTRDLLDLWKQEHAANIRHVQWGAEP